MTDRNCFDPALAALDTARQAELRFLCVAQDAGDEQEAALLKAETSWLHANDRFADTVPTTAAGAIAKLQAVEELLSDVPMPESSLEVRHLRAVVRYLEHQQASSLAACRAQTRRLDDPHTA